ncbi:RRQRL motif-containing zinc-binding protein [Nocardia testacea]|uniref:RRQRL motif-containing zinc-binding protein n=1 Tax=Nocardia testacea TaxID=248551 RepID=UPI003A8950DB
MIGPKDVKARSLPDVDGSRFGLPTYYWGTAPEGLATRRQLREMGLRPNGQDIAAQAIRPRRGGREPLAAYLYRVENAAPKRQATPAQLAAVARATRARQERAMSRHGIEAPEVAESATEWTGWDGFER